MSKKKSRSNARVRDKPETLTANPNNPPLTLDAFSNSLARLGFGTPNIMEFSEYTKTNFTADYATITTLYRENWVVKRIVDVVAEDMTKNWYRLTSQITPEAKRRLTRLEARTHVRAKVLEGLKWGRLYGGAAAVIIVEGQEDMLDQPLNYDLVMPGGFKGLIVVDRWSGITPDSELVEDIGDPDFGLPKYYTIADEALGMGLRVHHSRVIRFIGRPLPNIEQQQEQYWGTSELEHVFSELKKYDNTGYNIASLVFSANLKVYQMDGFEQIGTLPPSAMKELYQTLSLMNWMMSSQGMQIMGNKDTFTTHPYTFAGLSEIYQTFMLDVSGAAEIPVTKLFGRSPAGLNATGESDLSNYADVIEGQQEATLRPMLEKLLPVMCLSEFGAIPDDLDFEFEPVRKPSEEEKKTILTQITGAVAQAYQAGIISQQIALKELREAAKSTGMWTNISDDDIERADADFGLGGELPPPPDIMTVGQEQEQEQQTDECNDGEGDVSESQSECKIGETVHSHLKPIIARDERGGQFR